MKKKKENTIIVFPWYFTIIQERPTSSPAPRGIISKVELVPTVTVDGFDEPLMETSWGFLGVEYGVWLMKVFFCF